MALVGFTDVMFSIEGSRTWYRDDTIITIGAETIIVTKIGKLLVGSSTILIDKTGNIADITEISNTQISLPIRIVDKNGLVGTVT